MTTTERGIVTAVKETTVLVKTDRSSACESCDSKGSCHSLGGGKEREVEAANLAGAKEGDHVIVSFHTSSLLKLSFLLYVFPILCLIAGAVIGQKLAPGFGTDPNGLSVLGALIFFLLAFIIVRVTSSILIKKDKYQAKVTKIV